MNILKKYEKYFYIIILIGVVIYFPIFFNGFVWDDFDFILNNPQVHQLNIPQLFGPSIFNGGSFYRPIPSIYFAIVYSLFEKQAFFYHILQLSLHLINTILILVFFGLFFSDEVAFFLALLFLVHPINVESVAFIGSTTSELFFVFGITAFLYSTKQHVSHNKFFIIFALLLLSVLTKETGMLFLFLIMACRRLFKLGNVRSFFAGGILITLIYFCLRVLSGGVIYHITQYIPIATLSFGQRLLNIPAIFIYYLKTFIFPLNLAVWQDWVITTLTMQNFIVPLLICVAFCLLLLLTMRYLYKDEKRQEVLPTERTIKKKEWKKQDGVNREIKNKFLQFVFFSLWFLLGMSLIMQIVPLEMTVADRWFYFPIIGVLGLLGIGLQNLKLVYQQHRKLYYLCAIIILSLLSLRTFIRTFDWKDDITLFTHDLREENDNYLIYAELTNSYYNIGKIDEALVYAKKTTSIYPGVIYLNNLGILYKQKHEYQKAIDVFTQAIQFSQISPFKNYVSKPQIVTAYTNLALVLLLDDRSVDAVKFINEQAIKHVPQSHQLYAMLAIAEYNLHNKQKALTAANKAFALSHGDRDATLVERIQNNLPVSILTQ